MITSLIVISLAFTWLLYESDWMRVRLPVGAIKESIKTIKLWQFSYHDKVGISQQSHAQAPYYNPQRDNTILMLNVGITEPVCGWDWILNHEHPIIENHIEIIAHNCKHTITLCDNPEVDYGRIMKDVCSIAFKANIRPKNGRKPHRKGQTFNPNYHLDSNRIFRAHGMAEVK